MWPVKGWQRPLGSITVTILAAAPFWLKAEARLSSYGGESSVTILAAAPFWLKVEARLSRLRRRNSDVWPLSYIRGKCGSTTYKYEAERMLKVLLGLRFPSRLVVPGRTLAGSTLTWMVVSMS